MWRSSRGSLAGTIAVAPAGSAAISSALAAATASTVPSNSRWTGPTLTTTPTSGSAIRASSAICPEPRIAISSTRTWVPVGADRISSGSPISVVKLAREATVRRCGVRTAFSRSLVDVLPVDPVTPIIRALSWRLQAVARRWSARSGSSAARTTPGAWLRAASACCGATSAPHAPASRAWETNAPPSVCAPLRPTNSAPGPASRESITARSGPVPFLGEDRRSAPAASAICSGLQLLIGRARLAGPRAPLSRRRTESSCRPRTPGLARDPCRR